MKTYSGPMHLSLMGTGSSENIQEVKVLRKVCEDIRRTRTLTDEAKNALSKTFPKRSDQALLLLERGNVSKFQFNPSGRTVWIVTGRKDEYQVLPETMFCTCDDYYFRVMGRKKQLCYHLIAQQLAETMGKYRQDNLRDADYETVTARWKLPKGSS